MHQTGFPERQGVCWLYRNRGPVRLVHGPASAIGRERSSDRFALTQVAEEIGGEADGR
jgi:hypothetical protein